MNHVLPVYLLTFLIVAVYDAWYLSVPMIFLILLSLQALVLAPFPFLLGVAYGLVLYLLGHYSDGDIPITGALASAVGCVVPFPRTTLALVVAFLALEASLFALRELYGRKEGPVPVGPGAFTISILVLAAGGWGL